MQLIEIDPFFKLLHFITLKVIYGQLYNQFKKLKKIYFSNY